MSFAGHQWGLILGGSSGLGLATAHRLSAHGMNLAIVHRDRRAAAKRIEAEEFAVMRQRGVQVVTFNANALAGAERQRIIAELAIALGESGRLRLLLHSIALGNLKPLVADKGSAVIDEEDLAGTIYNMGTSLHSWVRAILDADLFDADARVLGLTSEGNEVAWRGYAAISAAKVAMESLSRSMALEMAPLGIRSNIVQAGIAETPASAMIPGIDGMKAAARKRNPFGRLTCPEDVAGVIYLLCRDEAAWINGTIVRVDGGEHIAGGC